MTALAALADRARSAGARLRRWLPIVAFLAAPSLAPPAPARAWVVRALDVRIAVLPDARIRVIETIHATFGHEHERGITRIIPLSIADAAGYRTRIDLRLQAVTDADGRRWPSRLKRTDRDVRVWIGAREGTFAAGDQVFVLTYQADGAILGGPTRDELYWQVAGYQWDVPIREAQATVELPPGVDVDKLDASSLAGKFGDLGRPADMRTLDASQARFVVKRGLVPREGFLVSVVWPSGLIEHPGPGRRTLRLLARKAPYLAAPIALAVLAVWMRRRRLGRAALPDSSTPPA